MEIIKTDQDENKPTPETNQVTPEIAEFVEIPAEQLLQLLEQNDELVKQRDLLKYGVLQICGLLGLTNPERTQIKPEVANGEEGVFSSLLGEGMELFTLFTKTSLPGKLGRNAEEAIKEKFAFIEKILPVLKNF